MALVSIVVPVYNVEKYLDRCIYSLQNQTLKDIEIILVDDGSPDHSPEICDQYAGSDNRIQVIHKKNGGLSSARNAGMRVASGKYIGFVDSDDDIELDMYEKMFAIAEKYQVNFVMSDYQRILSDGSRYLKTLDIRGGLYQKEDIIENIYPSLIMGDDIDYGPLLSVWHCLYHLDFLRRNHIGFDEEVRWSEDNIFSALVGYKAETFYYLKGEGLYHYYQNQGTITTSYREGSWEVYKTMNERLKEVFEKVEDYDFQKQLKYHILYYACNCLNQTQLLSPDKQKACIANILYSEEVRWAFQDISITSVSFPLRMQLWLMKHKNTNLLRIILNRRARRA